MEPADNEMTAYHEAGHAVVALALGRTVHKVSVLPNRERMGECRFGKGNTRASDDWVEREILIALGGLAAEARHTGTYATDEAARAASEAERADNAEAEVERLRNELARLRKADVKR